VRTLDVACKTPLNAVSNRRGPPRTEGIVLGFILVVDDDPRAGEAISALLEGAGLETRLADSGEDALAVTRERRPQMVLLDVRLPGVSGYEVLRALRDQFGESLPIMFVSGERVEAFDRVAGLLLGADDYLVKPFAPDELIARVRRLVERSASDDRQKVHAKLTRREREVLALLASGLTQPEIAQRLVISPSTVASHIEHILGKLDVHSRAEAVAVAHRSGFLEASDLPAASLSGPTR
jgi:DNA-binding NarL/FixJ family response regulator